MIQIKNNLIAVLICSAIMTGGISAENALVPIDNLIEIINQTPPTHSDHIVNPKPGVTKQQNTEKRIAWFNAALTLGELRSDSVVGELIPHMGIPRYTVGGMPSLEEYPAAVALAKIGYSAVKPIIDKATTKKNYTLIGAFVLLSIMPLEPVMATLKEYEKNYGQQLDSEQKSNLKRLTKFVGSFGRSLITPKRRPPSSMIPPLSIAHPSIVLRNEMIEINLSILKKTDWDNVNERTLTAIKTLGDLRAIEACAILSKHMSLITADDRGPVVMNALSNIGLPSISYMLKEIDVEEPDEAELNHVALFLLFKFSSNVAIEYLTVHREVTGSEGAQGLDLLHKKLQSMNGTNP